MGVISPLGKSPEEIRSSLLDGRVIFERPDFEPEVVVSPVRDFELRRYTGAFKERRYLNRGAAFALAAALDAVRGTGLTRETLADLGESAGDWITSRGNVASLRLDNVAAEGFALARSEMAELIRGGRVQLNWVTEMRPDRAVKPGDMISLRGYGRLRLAGIEGQSRKGRFWISLERSR